MANKFITFLGGREGEEERVSLLLAMGFFMGVFLATLQVPAETLITALGDQHLDRAFFVGGTLGVISALLYVYLQRYIPFSTLAVINTGVISVTMLAARMSFYYLDHELASFILFVIMGPIFSITLLSFWGIFGRIFDVRSSKRIVGGIDTGQLSATFLAFFMISFLSDYLSTLSILWISVVSSLGVFILSIKITATYKLDKAMSSNLASVDRGKSMRKQKSQVNYLDLIKNKYFLMLSLFLAFSVCASKFNEFTYRSAMFAWHAGNEAALNKTYSLIDAIIIVVSFLVQSFLNDYIIGKYGLKVSLMVMPILLGLFTVGAIVSAHIFGYDPSLSDYFIFFSFNVMGRILTAALRDALENPAFKMFFFPVNERDRFDVQSRIEGVVNSFAALLVGVVLIVLGTIRYFEIIHFSYILMIAVVGSIFMAAKLFNQYKITLKESLVDQKKKLQTGSSQFKQDALSAFKKGLLDPKPAIILFTLKLIERMDPFLLRKCLPQMLNSSLASIKSYAYKKCVSINNIEYLYDIQKISRDESHPKLSELAQETSITLANSKSHKPSVEEFLGMFRSRDAKVRKSAAQLLANLPEDKYTVILVELMQDSDASVREAAIISAGHLKSPDLWPTIIASLHTPAYTNVCCAALIASGKAVFQTVDMLFYRTNQHPHVMLKVIQMLGKLGGHEGVERVWKKIDYPNKLIFYECLNSMSMNTYRTQGLRSSRLKLQIEEYIGSTAWNINLLLHIPRKHPVDHLIVEAIEEENKRNLQTIFMVMSMVYDPQSIQLVKENVDFGTPESLTYAIELMSTFLDELLKPKVFPLLDDLKPEERIEKLSYYYAPEQFKDYEDVLLQIVNRDYNRISRWTKGLAMYRLSSLPKTGITSDLIANIFNPDKYLLQVAAFAILQKDKQEYRKQTLRLDSKIVKQLDVLLLPPVHSSGDHQTWKRSLLDLEIAVFLKKIPLFRKLPGEILVDVAEISKEKEYTSAQRLIQKGAPGNQPLRIILRGQIKKQSQEQTTQLSNGDLIGLHHVLSEDVYLHDYITMSSCTCIEIPLDLLFKLMGMRIPLIEAFIEYMQQGKGHDSKKRAKLHEEFVVNT